MHWIPSPKHGAMDVTHRAVGMSSAKPYTHYLYEAELGTAGSGRRDRSLLAVVERVFER
jgi:hypothetical protein